MVRELRGHDQQIFGLAFSADSQTLALFVLGQPATLILFAEDYDGGHKAWVRWPDGSDDIVPGSQVTPTG